MTAVPSAARTLLGTWRNGDAASLAADDNLFYAVDSTASGTRTTSWYASFAAVPNELSSLRITYRGKQSLSATQRVAIWRWTDSRWVTLSTRTVGTTEVTVANVSPPGTLANYVSGVSGPGEVRIRIRSSRSSGTFRTRGELVRITYVVP